MFHTIDGTDISKVVAEEMGDLPEIIVKKILDHQFKEMATHVVNNNMEIVKLDFIGKFENGRRKFYENLQQKKFDKQIENIFKDYQFDEVI